MAHRASIWPGILLLSTSLATAAQPLQDPMRPPGHQTAASAPAKAVGAKAKPKWLLQSTLVSKQRRSAIINGHLVSPGERVHGARVLSIDPDHVVLDHQGRRLQLRPYNPVSKRNPQDGNS